MEVGDQVFISGQQALTENGAIFAPGDIAAQTRCVFENMKATLTRAGLELSDLVRLNTYYVFDGADEELPNIGGMTGCDLNTSPIQTDDGGSHQGMPYQDEFKSKALPCMESK